MCVGDDRNCPQFELHRQKLLDDLDAERRTFLKSAFVATGGSDRGLVDRKSPPHCPSPSMIPLPHGLGQLPGERIVLDVAARHRMVVRD